MGKLLRKAAVAGAALASYLLPQSVALAQGVVTFTPKEVSNLAAITAGGFITFIIRLLFIIAFVIAFIFLLIGGIRWIIAGGDEKADAQAHGTVTAALVGLVVILAAFAIIRFIEFIFNIQIISAPGATVTLPQIPT